MTRERRVLVTGALGKLGGVVVSGLRDADLSVVATDLRAGAVGEVEVKGLELSNPGSGLEELLYGVSAVVHCAAVPRQGLKPPVDLLASNVGATLKLCRGSLKANVKKFVYISSAQVIASEGRPEHEPPEVSYLPLDGECPPNPRNEYAFSKATGEILVEELLATAGMECQSLRFPWLDFPTQDGNWGRRLKPHYQRESRVVAEQGFACLSFPDAARLVMACLEADLPGYRTYYPAVSAVPAPEIPRYLDRYYRGVPLKGPGKRLESLIDLSRIAAETGWMPRDIPNPFLPEDLAGRLGRKMRRYW